MTTANFGSRVQIAIIDFSCSMLVELAHLQRLEMNTNITNMHKTLANLPTVAHRVRLNATKITLLHAISLHFLHRIKCNALPTTEELVALTAYDVEEMRTHCNESQQVYATDRLSIVKIPKLKTTNWLEFKSAINKTLSRATGPNKIPLSYVIRTDVISNFEDTYDSREERLVFCITQRGPVYKSDNSDVFSILLQHTEGTEGCSLVEAQERCRNGRATWLALLINFEGDTFKEQIAQEANKILRTVTYQSPRKIFNSVTTIHVIVKPT